MITIEVVTGYIKNGIVPIKDSEILLLRDIVRDQKWPFDPTKNRANSREFDSVSIMELLDYQVEIDSNRLKQLDDKKRLLLNKSKSRAYKQLF